MTREEDADAEGSPFPGVGWFVGWQYVYILGVGLVVIALSLYWLACATISVMLWIVGHVFHFFTRNCSDEDRARARATLTVDSLKKLVRANERTPWP